MLTVNESNFENVVLASRLPVLLKAYADWCPPCQQIAPMIEALEKRLDGRLLVVEVNVDEAEQLASELLLSSIPTLVVYRGGKEVTRFVGLQNEQKLIEALDLERKSTIPTSPSVLDSQNQIQVIAPYWHAGTWVFDDERTGLVKEPFVSGVPAMINDLVQAIPNARGGFRLLFSTEPFPGYERQLSWVRAEMGGNWYRTEQPQGEGWLCPALFRYFPVAPEKLFVKAENLN
jgi:thioredoxin